LVEQRHDCVAILLAAAAAPGRGIAGQANGQREVGAGGGALRLRQVRGLGGRRVTTGGSAARAATTEASTGGPTTNGASAVGAVTTSGSPKLGVLACALRALVELLELHQGLVRPLSLPKVLDAGQIVAIDRG